MERMDRARRIGGMIWVAAGVLFQVGWAMHRQVVPGPVTVLLIVVVIALAGVTVSGARPVVLRATGWAAAAALALDFAGAVADRFGLLGDAGTPGVSWGSWDTFVQYTAALLPWAPATLVQVAAVTATAAEVVLGVLLLTGWQHGWVGKATAGLLMVYTAAMLTALGPDAIARYGVPILIGGALLVSAVRPRYSGPPNHAATQLATR